MNVRFHLYFPTEVQARRATETLKADGFDVETRPSADALEWIAIVSPSPTEKDFDAIEKRMESFARLQGGRFDGYEEGVRAAE